MWSSGSKSVNGGKTGGRNGLVAVAIDKDKGSQYAIKWAIDNLLNRGQTVILIHAVSNSSQKYATKDLTGTGSADLQLLENHTKELFLTFHCFCTRKDIQCFDVVLEDTDVSTSIVEFVANAAIENLVLGASRHGFLKRLKTVDLPTSVSKGSPDFCTVYTISKSKISAVRNASRMAPFTSPLLPQIQQMQKANDTTLSSSPSPVRKPISYSRGVDRTPRKNNVVDDVALFRSPLTKERGYTPSVLPDAFDSESDISFVTSSRPSTDISVDSISGMLFDASDSWRTSRVSTSSASSYGSWNKLSEQSSVTGFSSSSVENEDAEAEMRRLKIELQKTMEMYNTACREALTEKQKAVELHRWRIEEERRLETARLMEEAARFSAEQEKAKYKAALEDGKRLSIEMGASNESRPISTLRYRKYSIEDIEEATKNFSESLKIGEGGYGPVYYCHLDHTPVAIKVLRPDAAQGKIQFDQEVEVLSCLRHPNMVLLLGACPEYGCLVYEYMSNGSLEDCLFKKGNKRPLSWQVRFRIAAEIATGLHFLHQTKPEPLVHRDLKPANILLDRNYVSKIGDVGLARLVPPSVADDMTQLRLTSTAGTFCYIDPEYQQTGMLGVKSDVYAFGIVLLQILTAKPAMGLSHTMDRAVEKGTVAEMLDPSVQDWPLEEALSMAKLGIQCSELRRKDRPDLGKIVLPELNRLRELSLDNNSVVKFSSTDEKVVKSVPNVESVYSETNEFKSSASLPDQNLQEEAS